MDSPDLPVPLKRQALLIGPSYDLLPSKFQLDGPPTDLEIMKRIISRKPFEFNHIMELTQQNATKNNILSSLAKITHSAEEGSIVMVYYSGHGWQLSGGAGTADLDEGLLPADVTTEDIKSGRIDNKCVTGADMGDCLLQLSSKKVWVTFIFDCCFSGHMYRGPDFKKSDFRCMKAREVTCAGLRKLEKAGRKLRNLEGSAGALVSKGTAKTERRWKKISEGWLPRQDDKFFHLAACSSIEKAWEGLDHRTNRHCGLFTSTLGDILEDWDETRGNLSYNALSSLVQREFKRRNISIQTPQKEGTNLDTVLFGVDIVQQTTKLVDVATVITEDKQTIVHLRAGHIQLLQDGEYDVFEPTVEDLDITRSKERKSPFWVGAIDVKEQDIGMATAIGYVIESPRDPEDPKGILPGCKAHLRQRHSARTSVAIISPDVVDDMKERLDETQMFTVRLVTSKARYKVHANEVELTKEAIDNKQHWCARVGGDMIVPPVYTDQHEDIMAANLVKYFRYYKALEQPPSNDSLLLNVELSVYKLEKVKPFGRNPVLRRERLDEARGKTDVYAGHADDPHEPRPRFLAHKLKQIKVNGTLTYRLEDETGDAIVTRVTNNEDFPIYIVLLMYQLDGSIVVMYPPRMGDCIILGCGESVEDIHRIHIPEYALEKFTQPDPTREKATEGIDTIVLYATTNKGCKLGPLLQQSLELGGKLKGRGDPIAEKINPLKRYLATLKRRCLENVEDDGSKWLIEKREFAVVANND